NRPHQLHQLLGQSVPCSAHRRCLCSDAGVALARCRHRLCSRSSLHVARTPAEARRSGLGLGTTRSCPSAGFLPVSTRLPSCGSGARRGNRLNPSSQYTNSTTIHTDDSHGTPVSPFGKLNIPIWEIFDSLAPLLDQPQLSGVTTHFAPMTGTSGCLHELCGLRCTTR